MSSGAQAPARLADRLAVAGSAAFLVLGVVTAILGPLLPALRERFHLDAGSASILFSVFAVGTVLGVPLAGRLLARRSSRWAFGTGLVILAIGCALAGTAGAWNQVVTGIALAGLGFGTLQLTLHVTVASGYGRRSASVLTAVSAAFGVGAILGPVLAGFTPSDFRLPYLYCAVAAAMLLPLALSVRVVATRAPEAPRPGEGRARREASPIGFGLLLFGEAALEVSVAGWATTHLLEHVGLAPAVAARSVALFFLGLSVGRIIVLPLTVRLRPGPLLVGALVLASASLAMGTVDALALAGYGLAGLFAAPVFPTTFAWMTRAVPSGRGRTAVFAAAMAGPILVAPVTGAIVDAAGAGSIPLTLAAVALLDAAIALGLALTVKSRGEAEAPAAEPVAEPVFVAEPVPELVPLPRRVTGAVRAGQSPESPKAEGVMDGGWASRVRPVATIVAGAVAVAGLVAIGTRRRRRR